MTKVRPSVFEARLRAAGEEAIDSLRSDLMELEARTSSSRVGRVTRVGDGVATVAGLHHPFAGELMDIAGVAAVAEELREHEVRVVLLGDTSLIQAGDTVRRLGRVLEVPVGPELLGRVVDPLGRPLDGRGSLHCRRHVRTETTPVELADREPVQRVLRTGVFALDTMIPIGLGQRQLVIGDRSTGKTELCLDILAAMDPEVVPVYVAIGQRGSETAAHLERLRRTGALERGFAVVSDADDPSGLIHLTPYAATAMAEDLALQGRDVVVVYDDLTTHAHVHRTLALLLDRPVGREAYPVDVFYAHARLLERATQLGASRGNGSLTAFPVVETQLGDLTGYIPTNLVSITDGQVRLDAALAAADIIPAVDVALSVSRVGGKVQPPLVRRLAGSFKNEYAQFLELESFARFGTRLEPGAQAVVDWGRRVRRVLRQERGVARTWSDTVARLVLISTPEFAKRPLELVEEEVEAASARLQAAAELQERDIASGGVGPELIDELKKRASPALQDVLESGEEAEEAS